MDMAVDLCPLAIQTGAGQSSDEASHEWPTKTGFKQFCCSPDPWMMQVVETSDRRRPELGGHKRSEAARGDVSQQGNIAHQPVNNNN
jgi:hypothetical protein